MLGVTAFGLFLTPVFYSVIGRFAGRRATVPLIVPSVTAEAGGH